MAGSLSAVVLGVPNIVSMGIARGWMLAGHSIQMIWYPQRLRQTSAFHQDRHLSRQAPGVTLHGLEQKARVATRAIDRLEDWPEAVIAAQRLKPDVIISLLYPDRIPADILAAFPDRVFNLHPSLLPAYRGANPVFNMLWDGTIQQHGGMTLHLVSPEFDRGATLGQLKVPFPADVNLTAFYMQMVKAGSELLANSLAAFAAGRLPATPQPDDRSAPQGRRKLKDAILGPCQTAAHAAWLCRTIPQMTPLRIEGLPDTYIVAAFAGAGPKTKTPPEISDGVASFDVQDGRISARVVALPAASKT